MKPSPIVDNSDDTGLWNSILDEEEQAAFADIKTLGGPGSGRYPKGSGQSSGFGFPYNYHEDRPLDVYVRGDANDINWSLRKNEGLKPDSDWKTEVEAMDKMMTPLDHTTELYRVVPQDVVEKLKPGTKFKDHAFVSTTKSQALIPDIMDDTGMLRGKVGIIKIHTPKGTKHIDVNKTIAKSHMYVHQKEVILARGTKFRVVSVEDGKPIRTEDGYVQSTIVHVEVVK